MSKRFCAGFSIVRGAVPLRVFSISFWKQQRALNYRRAFKALAALLMRLYRAKATKSPVPLVATYAVCALNLHRNTAAVTGYELWIRSLRNQPRLRWSCLFGWTHLKNKQINKRWWCQKVAFIADCWKFMKQLTSDLHVCVRTGYWHVKRTDWANFSGLLCCVALNCVWHWNYITYINSKRGYFCLFIFFSRINLVCFVNAFWMYPACHVVTKTWTCWRHSARGYVTALADNCTHTQYLNSSVHVHVSTLTCMCSGGLLLR